MRKSVSAILFLLVGFVFGGIVGAYYAAQKTNRPIGRLLVMGATAFKGNNAVQLYKTGEYPAAREALLEYVSILEEVSANPEYGNPKILRTDMALALTRLALLEEAHGHQEQADEFMKRAVEEAKRTRWEEPSEANLRRFVEQVDKYKPSRKHD